LLLALAQGADLLILDEPTTALDPVSVDQFMRILAEDARVRGCTVFFSSHQLEEVEQIGQHVGIMNNGKLLLESRVEDIKQDFRLITATGTSLPSQTSAQVLSVAADGASNKYVVTNNSESFATELCRNGATVTSIAPLSLREIFLQLVRKETSCTSGNAGATSEHSSSAS
jgi:ABC-2 type transport system ATP-binding protein